MATGHVMLKFYVDNQRWNAHKSMRSNILIFLSFRYIGEQKGDQFVADRFLIMLLDIGREQKLENGNLYFGTRTRMILQHLMAQWGSRWDNEKKWNLRLEDEETGEKIDPRLSLLGMEDSVQTVQIPYFSDDGNTVLERTIPVKKVMTEEGGSVRYNRIRLNVSKLRCEPRAWRTRAERIQ